jgi:hypothetical protein
LNLVNFGVFTVIEGTKVAGYEKYAKADFKISDFSHFFDRLLSYHLFPDHDMASPGGRFAICSQEIHAIVRAI